MLHSPLNRVCLSPSSFTSNFARVRNRLSGGIFVLLTISTRQKVYFDQSQMLPAAAAAAPRLCTVSRLLVASS